MKIPNAFNNSYLGDTMDCFSKQYQTLEHESKPLKKNRGTQTDYRDSETQTIPWESPYKITAGQNLEILTLSNLTWGHGLPAGMHEVEIIKRTRKRRAWEALMPPMNSSTNIKINTAIITSLEAEDWAFREKEIEYILNLRMELNKKIMEDKENNNKKKIELRLLNYNNYLNNRRNKEINNIRHKFDREFRKLTMKYQSRKSNVQKNTIKLNDAPCIYFEEDFQIKHQMLQKTLSRKHFLKVIEHIDTNSTVLPNITGSQPIKPKPRKEDLCIRETRWNEDKLRKLYEELRAIRCNLDTTETTNLLKRKIKVPPLPPTPRRPSSETFSEDNIRQSCTMIQKIVKGRAVQGMMQEGRDRCKDLIKELQSTHALQDDTDKLRLKEKAHMIDLQHEQNYRMLQEDRLSEILCSLEGMTVSGMLDFLSKELVRLKDERKAHAFALMAERSRKTREAEQRQTELERRELDDLFRQIAKINQDSVEIFLEDVIKEGIEWTSEEEAKEYILSIAGKTDEVSKYIANNAFEINQEEIISDTICSNSLTEVDKQTVEKKLHNVHSIIQDEIFNRSTQSENEENNDTQNSDYFLRKMEEIDESVCHIVDTIISYVADNEHHDTIREILSNLLMSTKMEYEI